ncbi:MAG: dihydroorotate dehydrogenase electron transfer subunit [Candidatus Aenigmatarchaeota archaeon]
MIFDTSIAYNIQISRDHFILGLENGDKLKPFKPGQFIMLRIEPLFDPFLRRPFSIYRIKDGIAEVLYKVVGKGTLRLKEKRPGSILNILGPLGNGFPIENPDAQQVLIGGGIGAASLYALCEEIKNRDGRAVVLLGGKGINDIPWADDFRSLDADVFISTEDGSSGWRGTVIDLLYELMDKKVQRDAYFYVCGPWDMIKVFGLFAKQLSLRSYVSMERNLACGLGMCLGCAVKVREDEKVVLKRVCKDGPVFKGSELVYDA